MQLASNVTGSKQNVPFQVEFGTILGYLMIYSEFLSLKTCQQKLWR